MFQRFLTFEFGVESVLEISSRSEIDEFEIESFKIDQKILVLDVSMDDSFSVASQNCFDNLSEKVSGQLLFQDALLGDEVEEVFAAGGLLHDVDEGVVTLVEVEESDDAADRLNL
jgi:hypothetical protein